MNPHEIHPLIEAVTARLNAETGMAAEYFPEQPAAYRLTGAKGVYLVSVLGRDYSDPKASHGGLLPYRLRVQITIVSRALSAGKHSAYSMLESAFDALAGWRWQGRPLWPTREFYIGNDGDLWKYGAIYTLNNLRS